MENKIKSFIKKLSGGLGQGRKDPVCGMEVKTDLNKSEYQGKTYYFCSSNCKNQFDSNPANFAN